MRQRWKILLLAACGLIAVVAVCFFCVDEREPSYNGRTLSEWLDPLVAGMSNPEAGNNTGDYGDAVKKAVNEIGTNAAPWLVKWTFASDRPTIQFLTRHRAIPGANQLIKHAEQCANRGWVGLQFLGSNAVPYVSAELGSADPRIRAKASELITLINMTVKQSHRTR